MPRTLFLGRLFLFSGGALLLLGLYLWHTLPVPLKNPPYFITGLLAYGYGCLCYLRVNSAKRKAAKK